LILLAVPNISEGRRPRLVRQIAGPAVLDVHVDPDHNRSVLTYAGGPEALFDACTGMIERAIELLDLNAHDGVHPRFGVVDVLPIVPYQAARTDAAQLAQRIADASPIPVYMYEDDLPDLRRRLRAGHRAHPTAGVICIGVRGPLIAFNVNLRTDLANARRIVRDLRRLPGVRALAFELQARGLVQVSMNLVDPSVTGPGAAFDRIATLSDDIEDAEIVGLIPESNRVELQGIPLQTQARTIEDVLGR